MFPGRTRPQQSSEIGGDSGRDSTRRPAIVSLELKPPAVTSHDVQWSKHRKPRNRSFSPQRLDTSAARTDVRYFKSLLETKTASCKSALTDEIMSSVTAVQCDGLPLDSCRQSCRFQLDADALPATTTNVKVAATRFPPLINADIDCRVSDVNEATPRRKLEETARPFEVCAVRLNPDIRSTATKAQFHQQQSAISGTDDNSKTAKSVSATSSSSDQTAGSTGNAVKLDLALPLSDTDNDNKEKDDDDGEKEEEKMMEYRHTGSTDKMATGRRVGYGMPGIMEASCPILSVRIEFCKSRIKHDDADNATPPTTRQNDSVSSGSGDEGRGRRRLTGRTTKNTRTASRATSTSKAVSVAGRGKVVVVDDGVYDQFARRQPPKYLRSRTFDAMLYKRASSK